MLNGLKSIFKSKKALPPAEKSFLNLIRPDSWREYYSEGITPETFVQYLKDADQGDVQAQFTLFGEMEAKDLTLFSELQKRKLAVVRHPWEIQPKDDSTEAGRIAEFCQQAIDNLVNFTDDRVDMLDALGKGISFNQINWDASEGQVWPRSLEYIEPWHFQPYSDDPLGWRILTVDNFIDGVEIPERKFVIHKFKAVSGSPVRAGLTRILGFFYIFKNYAIKDWLTFLDLYGIPMRIGKYEPGTPNAEINILKHAVMNLATDAAAVISKNTEIEIKEALAGAGANPHQVFVEYVDKMMRIAINGQTLTSDIGDTGSYAAATTHKEVKFELTQADAIALDNTIRFQLLEPVVFYNFGPEAVKKYLPIFRTLCIEPRNLTEEIKVDQIFAGIMGTPIPINDWYKKYGWRRPEEGEETLQQVAQANRPEPTEPKGEGDDGEDKDDDDELNLKRSSIIILKKKYQRG